MNCSSCGAPIIWAVTTKGKRIPIDDKPSDDGNIRLVPQGQHKPPLAEYHSVRVEGMTYHKSHFATCPNAAKHRKKNETKFQR